MIPEKKIYPKNKSIKKVSSNQGEKDEECDIDIVPNKPVEKDLNYVMSNSLGFGGHNSSIILKKYVD